MSPSLTKIRWAIEGCPYQFTHERQARAFALPGQRVFPVQVPQDPESFTTLEFDLEAEEPFLSS